MRLLKHHILRSIAGLFLVLTGILPANAQEKKIALKIVKDLTAPEMHGRGYVNNGCGIAADYIANAFEGLGLKKFNDSFFQEFSFDVNTFPGAVSLQVDGIALTPGTQFEIDPMSPAFNGERALTVVSLEQVKNGTLAELLSDPSFCEKNCVVFNMAALEDDKTKSQMYALPEALAEKVPVIILQDNKFTWSVGRRVMPNPVVRVQLDKWDHSANSIELNIEQEFITGFKANNVVGYIEGTHRKKKKKMVVLTGHYDHLGRMGSETYFPGANDNASGIATLLSLAHYYSEHPPEYTIVFMCFAGEEAGLLGSKYYTEHPLFKLKKIRTLINLDIMGTGDEGITVVNAVNNEDIYNALVEINDTNDYLAKVKKRNNTSNSDHYFFAEAGVPAIFIYTMGGVKHYHDVYDKAKTLPMTEFEDVCHLLCDFIQTL